MSIKRPAPDHDHDDSRGPPQEEDSEEARARADKKRKVLEENKAAQRKRGNRMFGVMLGTLQRAKKQVEQVEDSGAGKKRAQLQERLREKLDAERKEAIEKTEREKEMRELRAEIARREDEITAAESIVSFLTCCLKPGHRALCLAHIVADTLPLAPRSTGHGTTPSSTSPASSARLSQSLLLLPLPRPTPSRSRSRRASRTP